MSDLPGQPKIKDFDRLVEEARQKDMKEGK